MKEIVLREKHGVEVWRGSAGELVDDMACDIEKAGMVNMERFAWALAALADDWPEGFEHNMGEALGYPDLIVDVDGKPGPFTD